MRIKGNSFAITIAAVSAKVIIGFGVFIIGFGVVDLFPSLSEWDIIYGGVGIDESQHKRLVFNFLANFKIENIILNIINQTEMGNQQMQDMMSPDQMKMAKIKAAIEEIESSDSLTINTHAFSQEKMQVHDHDHKEDNESTTSVPSETPTNDEKTEYDLFKEVFEKQYPTSSFKTTGEATEVTLSKVDFVGVLARQVATVDEQLHRLLTFRPKLQTKYETQLNELALQPASSQNPNQQSNATLLNDSA